MSNSTVLAKIKDPVATVIGAIAILFFGVLITYMIANKSATKEEWDRLVFVLGGVEPLVFAAAGYFFGREVNRERAKNAEERAVQSEQIAVDRLTALKSLAIKIRGEIAGPLAQPTVAAAPPPVRATPTRDDRWIDLANYADRLVVDPRNS